MGKHLIYHQTDGIHNFIWKADNRRAVDTWLKWMTHIMVRDGEMGCILLDFSEIGLPPVRYSAMQIRRWLTLNPPAKNPCHVALVYSKESIPFLIVARSYAATMGRGRPMTLQFFSTDEMDAAHEWLQSHIEDSASTS